MHSGSVGTSQPRSDGGRRENKQEMKAAGANSAQDLLAQRGKRLRQGKVKLESEET